MKDPATTHDWIRHFEQTADNQGAIPWCDPYRLTATERSAVASSIAQFELGEGSEGKSLMRRVSSFAVQSGEPEFETLMRAFIKEEHRHSGYLRLFMALEDIPRLQKHWVDGSFKFIRKLAGLDVCLSVLSVAEVLAEPYYEALRDATQSPTLRAICDQILKDEERHLAFQTWNFERLRAHAPATQRCMAAFQFLVLGGATVVVWMHHHRVFSAAQMSFRQLFTRSFRRLSGMMRNVSGAGARELPTGQTVKRRVRVAE